MVLAGQTTSGNLPLGLSPFDPTFNGGEDMFLMKLKCRHLSADSVTVLEDGTSVETLYARAGEYTIRVGVTDTESPVDLEAVEVLLDPGGSNISIGYDVFSGLHTKDMRGHSRSFGINIWSECLFEQSSVRFEWIKIAI